MKLKIVLAAVAGRDADPSTLDLAAVVARRFGAHIEALHIRSDPRDAIPFLGEGASGVLIEQIMTAAERDSGSRSGKARAAFDAWRTTTGFADAGAPGSTDGPTVAWREEVGAEDECMAVRGRVSDLIVIGRPPADESGLSTVLFETALFDTGRPVLVAPPQTRATPAVLESPVVIFWTGGAEVSRAVAAALPFLSHATRVQIIPVNRSGVIPDVTSLVEYLAWHKVRSETSQPLVSAAPNSGAELLTRVVREGAGLLVMGAYTQNRLRQLIYGSVTKHVLMNADLPVLMAH